MTKENTHVPVARYVDLLSGKKTSDLWGFLRSVGWKLLVPENFEHNNLKGVLRREEWKPVLGNILPIYQGMVWDDRTKTITDPVYNPQRSVSSLDSLLTAASNFFDRYQGKRIGVQLSGGLDSSIIIGFLRYFGISFHLIGMSTTRYEFRTERHIQQKLRAWGEYSKLIDYEEFLPMSFLEDVPPFQHPDLLVLNYGSESAMAKECLAQGIEILFSGDGGDNLFAEPIPVNYEECSWLPQVFSDNWLVDNIYAPYGVELIPFYADPGIMDAIYNLRLGQQEDNSKLWARKFFKPFIPEELSNFTYCADFWGLYIDGFQQALPTIRKLINKAFDLTRHPYFSIESCKKLLSQDLLHMNKQMYQVLESRTALAVWVNSISHIVQD